ncbi:MAG: DEAD/DEAH box helicase [Planctomycetota bacterium]|nr:MAG: DEAD/DEAH box helicase [Planctomycetota bacterium]
MQPGTIVRFRDRDWVLLPNEEADDPVFRLRPLTGWTEEAVCVHRRLTSIAQQAFPEERLRPSAFPLPDPGHVSDAAAAHLLWQSARLSLREGAAPLRCLGRISIRPRVYQFVPLLMALRLDPVRLFIADDVGVGKTIEALLVARELLDRGEVRRIAVLCPPYLCDQWQREMQEKFNIDAVVIRSSTISQLERAKPRNRTVYQHYPFQILSIDWAKSDRHRPLFLQSCPELVIVDEVHGATNTPERTQMQQRHRLLTEIAAAPDRHLILLTATPHSGVEDAFRSLLALLDPQFAGWDIAGLNHEQRLVLAKHFVQRTRDDIRRDWEAESCFPRRVSLDRTYSLSEAYRELFRATYRFCSELVRTGRTLDERRRRVRYWSALALLRCVMSSPAAAVESLRRRVERRDPAPEPTPDAEDVEFAPNVFEDAGDYTDDEPPVPPIEQLQRLASNTEVRRLAELRRMAERIAETEDDTKAHTCVRVLRELLRDGFQPIVWCRFVATAEYLGRVLRDALPRRTQVVVITGRIGDQQRRIMVDQIDPDHPRVLVATDCLSEGINLQEKFNAVLHYDLPWNPNRLEQREGRVDRYGQTAPEVRAVRFYGRDNPVDGAVIEVLLEKARSIYSTLGVYVPVPQDEKTVMEAVFNALFLRAGETPGRSLFDTIEEVQLFHAQWDAEADRERISRSRFAQRALKPEQVRQELEAVDAVLGDPHAVRDFLLAAAQRLKLQVRPEADDPRVYRLNVAPAAVVELPDALRFELPRGRDGVWRFSFDSPTPEGAEFVGRNHPFVAALARFLFEQALETPERSIAGRCGAVRTSVVLRVTALLLLRLRYLLQIPDRPPVFSEEVLVTGYEPFSDPPVWLESDAALRLLAQAHPEANLGAAEKTEWCRNVLEQWEPWQFAPRAGGGRPLHERLTAIIRGRAEQLRESHRRIRHSVRLQIRGLNVRPQFPPDLLGLVVLLPRTPSR